ncbi:MAG: alkaline phosphatase family protein [Candidatus Manganitrophaceae bacterium]|nr:MAG: alkaline phosphatase family protein [Candidatus Manganitrophaceae bacterium]
MKKTVVINVVGLTQRLLGPDTPSLSDWARRGKVIPIKAVTPAVTCTAQATYLTGSWPERHGIVGNGWYFRDECEIKFWRQSNKLVQAPKVWEIARAIDPDFTCANLFWWFNMYSTVDIALTPRPMYPADGRKIPDIDTRPGTIRKQIQDELGPFPLFNFWGPATSIQSTRWIAEAAQWIDRRHHPTLTLVYLPHLDYNLQRRGPDDPRLARDLREVDDVCSDLIRYYGETGAQIVLLSEYGITPVRRPIHLNRIFREQGWIALREELGLELLDPGGSAVFAVADHQVAHVYINDPDKIAPVRRLLEKIPGIEQILDEEGKRRRHINHGRAGELIAIAAADAWFTYYYWREDRRAPDFARTVDIHRKPGYDPIELFIDPALSFPKLKIGGRLLQKALGFRTLLDIIPLDATLIQGSHGRVTDLDEAGPLFITQRPDLVSADSLHATDVADQILLHLGMERREKTFPPTAAAHPSLR